MEPVKHQRWIGAGVIALLGLVVTFVLARETRKIGPGLTMWVEMTHAGPLVQGSKVRVAGRIVGQVEEVSFLPHRDPVIVHGEDETPRVALRLWISRQHVWLLREGSDYFINQPSLLSEPYLEVGLPPRGDPGAVVREGQVVRGVNPSSLDRLLVRSWAVIRELDTLMKTDFPEIAQLSLEISALEANFDAIAGDARKSAPAPREGFAKLFVEGAKTKLWLDEALPQLAGMGATVARAQGLVATGRATLAQLQARIDALTARIDFLRGQLDPARLAEFSDLLARVDVLTRKLDETLAGAEALTALLDSGQGTLAAFAQDMEIADEVKVVTKMLKEQPWLLAHPEMGAGKGPGL